MHFDSVYLYCVLGSQGSYSKDNMVRRPRSGDMNVPRPHALLIGSEGLPFSKTGGLADVLGALPPSVVRAGWDVTVALPRYRGVTAGSLVERFPIAVGGYVRDV